MEHEVTLWEMYDIDPAMPRKIRLLGKWTEEDGFHLEEVRKWIRRHDMEVLMKNISKNFTNYIMILYRELKSEFKLFMIHIGFVHLNVLINMNMRSLTLNKNAVIYKNM